MCLEEGSLQNLCEQAGERNCVCVCARALACVYL
jgi:hypothetical protein